MAKNTKPPTEIERGYITGGFAHTSVVALSDKIAEAVKNGDIKKFVVMAGCDGRKIQEIIILNLLKTSTRYYNLNSWLC